MPSPQIETQLDLVRAIGRKPVRMPRTRQELFLILANYRPEQGVDGLLAMIDFSGVTPADIHEVVLGRTPSSFADAMPGDANEPRTLFRNALLSHEFRRMFLSCVLTTFPEKGRDIFIHVPKCAGTDLILNLGQRLLPLPKLLEVDGWISDEEFLAVMGGIARAIPFHDRIFVHGHMELGEYIDRAGRRPVDRIFTIIRDPVDLMISQANYAIGRLRQNPAGTDPDTAEILEYLGLPRLPEDAGERELKDLAVRALLDSRITQSNRACTFLGRGNSGLYKVAMDYLVVLDVEITTTRYYGRWLRERWGIGESLHHNASEPLLTRTEVQRFYADALRPLCAEDQTLFDVVTWALQQTGTASVTGLDIARISGAGLLDDLPQRLRREKSRQAAQQLAAAGDTNLTVAQEPERVTRYLELPVTAPPGAPVTNEVLAVRFGRDGTGQDYRLDGWSVAEGEFTWTNGPESRLRLPAPPDDGTIVIRLFANPFVLEPMLPHQRVDVLVNDVPLGFAQIHAIAIIECEVPRSLLPPGEPITITLRLPTAARPDEIGTVPDGRLLGIALHELSMLQIVDAPAGAHAEREHT